MPMRQKQMRQGILLGLYALIALWLISLIWGLMGKARVAINEAHDAERQYETLERRRERLQANLEALNTPLGKDAAIRTAFGVARPGEEVIVVVPPAEATTTPEKSWWQKVKGWF
jgi:cell division protein FtsB